MPSRQTLLASASKKKKLIYQTDIEDANSLANQPPVVETLYTLEEIAILTEDLMSIDAPTDTNGRILDVRPKGHWFEFEVAKRLGYNYPPGGGLFPDIRHQALEIKHHTGKSTQLILVATIQALMMLLMKLGIVNFNSKSIKFATLSHLLLLPNLKLPLLLFSRAHKS